MFSGLGKKQIDVSRMRKKIDVSGKHLFFSQNENTFRLTVRLCVFCDCRNADTETSTFFFPTIFFYISSSIKPHEVRTKAKKLFFSQIQNGNMNFFFLVKSCCRPRRSKIKEVLQGHFFPALIPFKRSGGNPSYHGVSHEDSEFKHFRELIHFSHQRYKKKKKV